MARSRAVAAPPITTAWLVLAVVINGPVRAAEPPSVEMSLCAAPIRIELAMRNSRDVAPRRVSFLVCGNEAVEVKVEVEVDDDVGIPAAVAKGRFRVRKSTVDLDVTVPDGTRTVRYKAQGLPVGARAAPLNGAVPATVTIAPLKGKQLIARVVDAPLGDVVKEVVSVSGTRVDGVGRLSRNTMTLDFGGMPLPLASLLTLVADAGGVHLRMAGEGHFAFSTPEESKALLALQEAYVTADASGDKAARDAALERLLDAIALPPHGPADPYADYWQEAARLAEERKDFTAAERYVRAEIVHSERHAGGPHGMPYASALGELARLRMRADDDAEAIRLLERALPIAEADVGPVHAEIAPIQARLATLRQSAGKRDDAVRLYRLAIEGFESAAEPDTLALKITLEALSALLVEQDRLTEARPLLERELALERAANGDTDSHTGFVAWRLGDVLFRLDDLPAAAAALRIAADSGQTFRDIAPRLQAIKALDAFADPKTSAEASLPALRQRLDAGLEDEVRYQMLEVLRLRARSQRAQSPKGAAWRLSCAAFAEIEAADASARIREQVRDLSFKRCPPEIPPPPT